MALCCLFGYSQNTRYEIMMHANLHIGIFNRQLLRCTYNMIKFFFVRLLVRCGSLQFHMQIIADSTRSLCIMYKTPLARAVQLLGSRLVSNRCVRLDNNFGWKINLVSVFFFQRAKAIMRIFHFGFAQLRIYSVIIICKMWIVSQPRTLPVFGIAAHQPDIILCKPNNTRLNWIWTFSFSNLFFIFARTEHGV